MSLACASLIAFSLSLAPEAESAAAPEWNQWRGPNRDAISKETGLLKKWPEGGPALLWEASGIGAGFSTVSIKDGRIFTQGDRQGRSHILALDYGTGKELWAVPTGDAFRGGYDDHGPRGTPTIDGDVLYALNVHGDLYCLETASGKKRWSMNILEKFQGKNPEWKISESPLVVGDRLIVTPGGPDATIVALDKKTGDTLWTSKGLSDPPAYSSCILVDAAGVKQVVNLTHKGIAGVALDDGRFLWRYDRVANDVASIATPVHKDGEIFTTTFYDAGCALIRLKPAGEGKVAAEEVYFSRDLMNHHGGAVLVDGHIYCYHKDRDLKCLEWKTGKVKWSERKSVGKCSLFYADGCLYALSQEGVVGLIEVTPEKYKELSRFKLPEHGEEPSWAHPVISGGRLFIRTDNKLRCYEVKG